MRYAVIDATTNTVVNVIEMMPESDWPMSGGMSLVRSDTASPGDLYDPDSGEFEPPAPPPGQ